MVYGYQSLAKSRGFEEITLRRRPADVNEDSSNGLIRDLDRWLHPTRQRPRQRARTPLIPCPQYPFREPPVLQCGT